MTAVFVVGAQRAFTLGWKEAARPLLMDYIDHLAADITGGGASPDQAAALALTQRLPLTVAIQGPRLNWESHPGNSSHGWQRNRSRTGRHDAAQEDWGGDKDWQAILQRTTPDGHTLIFGIDEAAFEQRSRDFGVAIGALLLLTSLAWLYVRRLLRPLDAISAGARRFGAGDFSQPIPDRCCKAHDELGDLATT